MRFELIWIAPLPPQDSASTNFATTAAFPNCHSTKASRELAGVVGFEPTHVGFRIRCLNQLGDTPIPQSVVRSMRFELIWIAPLPPQDSASTNFATTAAFIELFSEASFCELEEFNASEEKNFTWERRSCQGAATNHFAFRRERPERSSAQGLRRCPKRRPWAARRAC